MDPKWVVCRLRAVHNFISSRTTFHLSAMESKREAGKTPRC